MKQNLILFAGILMLGACVHQSRDYKPVLPKGNRIPMRNILPENLIWQT